jgi:hypothetical protein
VLYARRPESVYQLKAADVRLDLGEFLLEEEKFEDAVAEFRKCGDGGY